MVKINVGSNWTWAFLDRKSRTPAPSEKRFDLYIRKPLRKKNKGILKVMKISLKLNAGSYPKVCPRT